MDSVKIDLSHSQDRLLQLRYDRDTLTYLGLEESIDLKQIREQIFCVWGDINEQIKQGK